MNRFHVGRVAIVSDRQDKVTLFSGEHEFSAIMGKYRGLGFAQANFPDALITVLDMNQYNPQVVVVQEATHNR